MNAVYLRPHTLEQALAWLQAHPQARVLAGGQSLLPALRLGLGEASHLIDLQDLSPLHGVRLEGDHLWVGAMSTHAAIARDALVHTHAPLLAQVAAQIADAQVREVGTVGGSLANHDPAACWPAAMLACDARCVTSQRTLGIDDFFQGLFSTALARDELLLGLRIPLGGWGTYLKHEHPASRFAMPGVAVVRWRDGRVRVALTGLGHGVQRWPEAEAALQARWSQQALDTLQVPVDWASSDVHASAAYRTHLARVLCRRAVAHLTQETHQPLPPSAATSPSSPPASSEMAGSDPTDTPAGQALLQGQTRLGAPLAQVCDALLDAQVLRQSIPGCETITREDDTHYVAQVRVGLGPISARFASRLQVERRPATPGHAHFVLQAEGQAGRLGQGHARIDVRLQAVSEGTHLQWQARPQLQGQLAQLGQRLVEVSARRLSAEFFERFEAVLCGQSPAVAPRFFRYPAVAFLHRWWRRLFHR